MQLDIKNVADKADMIINGYAFTQENKYIRVLNLNQLNHAAVIYNEHGRYRKPNCIRLLFK